MKKVIIILIAVLISLLFLIAGILTISSINSSPTKAQENPTEDIQEELTKINVPTDEEIGNNPIATIKLEGMEPMQFVLFPDKAPQSVENFISLANSGYYDGLTMHRIIPGFVAQGGDPTGTGAGGPGYTIKGEFPANGVETGLTHQRGALAWARSADYDSAGSQFYICLGNPTNLDNEYAVFGYMIDGEETLSALNMVGTSSGKPKKDVIIESVSVDTKGETYDEPVKKESTYDLET